jgi:hypothetical protein
MNTEALKFYFLVLLTLLFITIYQIYSDSGSNNVNIRSLKTMKEFYFDNIISKNDSNLSLQLNDITEASQNGMARETITPSPRIFCMILTSNKYLNLRAKAIYETWATKCDAFKFITKIPQNFKENVIKLDDILDPPGLRNDSYDKLTDKMFYTLKYLYSQNDTQYDFYLKADDDSFIFVDYLRKFLQDKNSSEPVTYGYDFKVIVPGGYHSGGGSYILSKEALKRIGAKLTESYSSCENSGIEDVGKT